MIENLTTNISRYDAETWVLMLLGFGWCALMIFVPQVMRGFQDAVDGLFGRERIKGHPLQSLVFYRIVGVVVLTIFAFAMFSTPKPKPKPEPEPTPPKLPEGFPFKIEQLDGADAEGIDEPDS